MAKYAIGLDYGTLSVRALMVDIHSGEEIATSVYEYPHGVMNTSIPTGRKISSGWALHDPQDYIDGLIKTVGAVMKESKVSREDVIGIGVDFTSSTVMPIGAHQTPLCHTPEFRDEPHAYVKLWKHHGAEEEAAFIDRVAVTRGEKWHSLYGGKVSSEWMMPKVLETIKYAPEVYDKCERYMEAVDWIVWRMTGIETRTVCGAGYKAFYHHEMGYPSKEFFGELDPKMKNIIEEKMDAPIKGVGETAGYLTEDMAEMLNLLPGTPVGTGIIDAHASVVGAGISEPETMMIVVGTSSCHMILSETEVGIPGVAGIVKDGIIPGYFAYEAGQCCVGDCFAWFVDNFVPASYVAEAEDKKISLHKLLEEKLEGYKAGQSGLIALDWFNGVRSPLMDFNLNGLIVGMNLLTKPEEIYMALIEATAYGTRMIIESFENAGIVVKNIVLSGGIPLKNKMFVQIYSDVCNREIKICDSSNACARGAAILGIAAASEEVAGYKNTQEIVSALGKISDNTYIPNPENVAAYNELYSEYKTLHQYFGRGINDVMKRLNKIRDEQNKVSD